MTPVVLAAGFASVAAFVVITLQDLMVGLLGARLIRGSRPFARGHTGMEDDSADGPVPEI